jgi:hypothetical protein
MLVHLLNPVIGTALLLALGFNLAGAVRDGGWPSQQPWLAVRQTVAVLLTVLVIAPIGIWVWERSRRSPDPHR